MMKKALLAAGIAGSLVLPVQAAALWVPPKPAIVKPENLDFSKHMLAMPLTLGMLPGKSAPAVALINRLTTPVAGTNSSSTMTYSAVPIGAASSGRLVVCIVRINGTATRTISSASIGGVSATVHVQMSPSVYGNMAIFSAIVPSGTTANVVITWNSSTVAYTSHVLATALSNVQSQTALSTDSATVSRTGSLTLNLQAGWFVVMAASNSSNLTYSGWSSTLIEYRDGTGFGSSNTGAALADGFPTSTDTAAALSVTASSSLVNNYLIGASFR